jgi:Bacterial Ig-like domain (group 3)
MHITSRWSRAGGALAAVAATVALASAQTAAAAPARTATTTGYTTTTFLQHALGLPTSDTTPAIEPVTYDRFQWLLQQPGDFAILIGDPATDASFAQRAQDVEAQALASGAEKVYWFDPNLSGNARIGSTTEPNLDIRNPAGITSLAAASQTLYDNAWKSLVGDYLGNGLTITHNGLDSESATVTVATSSKVNASGPYDYTSGTPANVQHSFFFIYNKDHVNGGIADKILSWTDLTTQASSTSTKTAVANAFATIGGASNLEREDQFAWWKDEVNAKHEEQSTTAQGHDHPVLTDADAADGWDVEQITYPELVDLLKSGAADKNAVILFGGTWCPNTRPVLPEINKEAQANGVHVFNFDTVLDGGLIGGTTTSARNPLQSRNTQNNGTTTPTAANPSFLYGDAVGTYLSNLKTEYDYLLNPTTDPYVSYFPGGDTSTGSPSGTPVKIRKLQVPFLIGYQGSSVTRQWIIDKGNGAYKEYMSSWAYTNPQPGELGLDATKLPAGAPIWNTINNQLATFTWQTDPATVKVNLNDYSDVAQYLVSTDTATVSYSGGTWTITSGGPTAISPAALTAALNALGASAPADLDAAKTALIAAQSGSDATLTNNLTTVVGAWQIARNRKSNVNNAWGTAVAPGSVAGGLAALHAVDVFFGGLPGGVLSRRTVTADASGITIRIDNDYGRNPAGNVALTLTKGGATVTTASAAVSGGTASFTLPALDAGTYDYTLTYAGDDQLAGFTESGSLTVPPKANPGGNTNTTTATTPTTPARTPTTTTTPPKATKARAGKVKALVVKKPTSRKGGKYTVSIAAPKGKAAVSGKVTIKLKKGKVTKTLTARLTKGVATFTLPKLAKGTWKVTIAWPGDAHYTALSATGVSIKVIK